MTPPERNHLLSNGVILYKLFFFQLPHFSSVSPVRR